MLDAIMNLITIAISTIVLIWAICNVIRGYDQEYAMRQMDKDKSCDDGKS